jgi:hypothetical protein
MVIGGELASSPASRVDFNGWLDEFRISKGIARWTSNFTPPTAPYDSGVPWTSNKLIF